MRESPYIRLVERKMATDRLQMWLQPAQPLLNFTERAGHRIETGALRKLRCFPAPHEKRPPAAAVTLRPSNRPCRRYDVEWRRGFALVGLRPAYAAAMPHDMAAALREREPFRPRR